MKELLPCNYFHVVLTLPPRLRDLAMAFPNVVLGALMAAASDAIDHLCRKPDFLGATVGQMAILHTWRRDLGVHPHVHVLVTAGGWNEERQLWVDPRRIDAAGTPFLVPVKVLLTAFRLRLRRLLLNAHAQGRFNHGPHEAFPMLTTIQTFTGELNRMCAAHGVARIEPPFGGPQQLLKYLGAYINRVAISPRRVTAYDPATGMVTYTWATNARPDVTRTATIPAVDFLHRFAQHILPPGFQRIRFRGWWSTAHRKTKLRVAQQWFASHRPTALPPLTAPEPSSTKAQSDDPGLCTTCKRGRWRLLAGTWDQPTAPQRRELLRLLRIERRTQTPTKATIPA